MDEEEVKSRAPKLVFKQLQAEGGRYVNLRKEGEKSRGWNIPLGSRLTFGEVCGRRWPSAEPHTASGDRDSGPVRGAEAAAARARQGLSFRGLQAPGPQTNTGSPTQSCADSASWY